MQADILIWALNIGFGTAILLFSAYYFIEGYKHLDEVSQLILIVALFVALHEFSYFLLSPLIYEITKMASFVMLFYAVYKVAQNNQKLIQRIKKAEILLKEQNKGL